MNAPNAARILVVTPTLGECRHLDETVAGVLGAGVPVLHVLSAPRDRLAALGGRFPQSRLVADRGREGGIYGAINAALDAYPDGWDWFTYINDDDVLLPGFGELARRHAALPSPEPVAYGDVEVMREDGRALARVTTEASPVWIPALLQQGISPLMQQGTLFSRPAVARLGAFDTRYRLCADLDFWLRAYASGEGFRHHRLRVARFRLREGQLSSDTALTVREQDEIVARLLPRPVPGPVKLWARLRYRFLNLPRYAARIRSSGFRRSYSMLSQGARPSK